MTNSNVCKAEKHRCLITHANTQFILEISHLISGIFESKHIYSFYVTKHLFGKFSSKIVGGMVVSERKIWLSGNMGSWLILSPLCVRVPPAGILHRQGLVSWFIKKEDLTVPKPSGREISALTANWAASRRALTGKYCLMISCSIALWNTVDVSLERFAWFDSFCLSWNLQLCRVVQSTMMWCVQPQECHR